MAALLEDAADRIAAISRADLQVLLRRAALLLRNTGSIAFDDEIEEVLRDLSDECGRLAMIPSGLSCVSGWRRTPICRCTCWTKMVMLTGMRD